MRLGARRVRVLASWLPWAAPAPFVLWALLSLGRGERRWDIVLTAVVAPALAYGSATTRRLFAAMYPVFLVAPIYDAQRLVPEMGLSADRVHACDLRELELRLFGVVSGGVRMTWPDLLQARSTTALDLFAAIPYGTFIAVSLGYGAFLYRHDLGGLQRFAWSFLVLNVVAFVTYRLYPAAPPWYVRARGCEIDLAQRASEGPHLANVDALLGVGYFAGFYGRSRDVFGAVPSLHVAYPLLVVLDGWHRHGWLGRTLAGGFFLSMCFAALYLDHHWVLDLVVGIVYTVVVHALVCRLAAGERAA